MKQELLLKYLQKVSDIIPAAISCLDLEQKYLGINNAALEASGSLLKKEDFYGKAPHDFFEKEVADVLVSHHQSVLTTKSPASVEETIKDPNTGKIRYFNTVIAPLTDDQNLLIGTVCTSIDITAKKMVEDILKKERIFEHLKVISSFIPANMYWLDLNNIIIGVNNHTLKAVGVSSYDEIIGKKVYDLYPKKMADKIVQHHTEAMRTKKTLRHEEIIKDMKTGEVKHFVTVKTPLYDDAGDMIGTIGVSLDITAQKQSEKLKLENAAQKLKLMAHDGFSRVVNQVVHDIRSPLASLLMIVKACSQIPERERLALRDAATSIGAIANNLLAKYNAKDTTAVGSVGGDSEVVLVSVVLLQLLTHKNFQYQSVEVSFEHAFTDEGEFAFIKVDTSAFKRALSNLVNNSVDALESIQGKVEIRLDASEENVFIKLKDTGKGIPPDILEKIQQKIEVTSGKEEGHGIGLGQVQEMLAAAEGKMQVASTEGEGTEITLTFPRVHNITWIADSLVFSQDNLVIVLDDDSSIHHAWDLRFEVLQPALEVKHFNMGEEALTYIEALAPADKKRVFLLSDFELLEQEKDGLDIIEQADVKRAILVTSYYANEAVRSRAKQLSTKILPKQLAPDVPMRILDVSGEEDKSKAGVDLVLVDDDEAFAHNLMAFIFMDKKVDYFKAPQEFRKRLDSYPKNIIIIIDNNFSTSHEKGIKIIKELHELGFTKLYLLSGEHFNPDDLPDYLVAIRKDEVDEFNF